MSESLIDLLSDEIDTLLDPLVEAVNSPFWMERLLEELGASSGAGGNALLTALQAIVALNTQIDNLAANPSPSFAGIAALLASFKNTFEAIRALETAGGPAQQLTGLAEDLIDFLLEAYLSGSHAIIYQIAVLLTLIDSSAEVELTDPVVVGGVGLRQPVRIARFHPERLIPLLQDPIAVLRAEYVNALATEADAQAMADKLFGRVARLLSLLRIPYTYGLHPADVTILGDAAPYIDHALTVFLATEDEDTGVAADAGLTLAFSSAQSGDLGLVVSPFGGISLKGMLGDWALELDVAADVEAFAYGRHGAVIVASVATTEIDGKFSATLTAPTTGLPTAATLVTGSSSAAGSSTVGNPAAAPPTSGGPAFIWGDPKGTRLEVGGAQWVIQGSLSEAAQSFGASLTVSTSKIVIMPADGDSFLSSVLPAGGLQTTFNFGIGWSTNGGFAFQGAAGLDATLPIGISVGGVLLISSLHLGLQAKNEALLSDISVTVGLSIGPVQAVISQVGVSAVVTFPQTGGNLGKADLTYAFKLPSGVGLAVDSAGVSGGGMLAHDDVKHEYSGVLQLKFNDLALQAFALITTPAAGSGYSLLALVDANFPPVQLGWGFTLDGVGGLLAVHRTASVDALRAAIKAGKLSFLFPKNAIINASQILGQLDTLFPTAPGRFLFGPMAQIGWGTPTILTGSVAVILEVPEPVEIILLATLTALLPNPSAPLVRLNMDALGVLDLTQDDLSLDASLFDSRLINFPIAGDMALRANWSSQREFLLAIGGFHHQFTPPSGFPTLNRVTIDMPSGMVSKLRLAAYLALTSNSVQFGATLDVLIGVSGCGISGHLGFDALLQLNPFHFTADISGSVAVTVGGDDLASVSLDATLTGPAPWNIAGTFKIHIIFFDAHVSFSQSWGHETSTQQTSTVDVGALLNTALADPRNWSSQLSTGLSALVATRQIDDASSIFAHPLALLEVHEQVVPLDLMITHFGEAVPSGATTFSITDFRVGDQSTAHAAVQDDFAPAQFFDLSDNDKLSRPSFERHDAGAIMTGSLVTNGTPLTRTIDYESFFINTPGVVTVEEGVPQPFPWNDLPIVMRTGSAARKAIGRAGKLRYAAPGNPIRVAEPAFALADTATLSAVTTTPAAGTTYSDIAAALSTAIAAGPVQRAAPQIVGSYELVMVTP